MNCLCKFCLIYGVFKYLDLQYFISIVCIVDLFLNVFVIFIYRESFNVAERIKIILNYQRISHFVQSPTTCKILI
jgi:hypothetical protein